ncbi:MAG: OmpA family protein [Gallionella sp.]|nr:OmpA family protein [Gallionella sp.]
MKRVAKTVGTLGLVGCAVMNSPIAAADDTGFYVGANIGQSKAKIDDARIISQLQGSGLATTSIDDNDTDTAFKIFGGYKLNKNIALEAGYFNLGQFGYTANTFPAGTLSGKINLDGVNLDIVGSLPITGKFSGFGRLGLTYAEARDSFTSSGAVAAPLDTNPTKRFANYKAGLGLQYDFNEALGLRGEWERYRANDAVGSDGDIHMYSIGLVYRFVEKKPAPAPVQKAAAPPPHIDYSQPVMVIVPVKVKTQQYCSILDLTFEINRDVIQRDDKEKLRVVGTFMAKYPDTTAVIEGHSDDVGDSDANMKLSQQRADSVVDYLVSDFKIDPSRLAAVGYGESRPIADNSTKEGKQANRRIAAVIACARDVAGLKVAAARLTMAMELEFDPYKATVEPKHHNDLREVADFMKANPTVTATVEGHAGKFVGLGTKEKTISADVAMEVSQKRAQNVVNYLVDILGVTRSRLATAQFGQTRRVAYGTTLEGQQENRRINIIFTYAK